MPGRNADNIFKLIYDQIYAKLPSLSGGKVPVVQSSTPPIEAGTAFIGRSGVKAFKFSQSFTRPNTITAYSANDAVTDSESSPTILTQDLASFGAVAGQFIVITNIQIVLSVPNSTANLQAWVFAGTFAGTNDNAALSIDDTTVQSGGHCISMPNSFSTALNTKLQADPGQYVMQLVGTSLYATLQTPSGYTPTAQAVYTLIIGGYLL